MAVTATAVWRVRPSGNNLNGGGYDPGIAGAATDYSQQNAAQASGSNATAAQNSTTFVDATANAFTSAMIGNAIWIASGTNFIANAYFVTGFTSASTVTLDRAPATAGAGSVGVWKLGGGWADFWTRTTSAGPMVSGNKVFILGSGTPNPSSYTYDYTASSFIPINNTAAAIEFANDPSTPGYKAWPDTTGGMPTIKYNSTVFNITTADNGSYAYILSGLWFVASGASVYALVVAAITGVLFRGCVCDQFGFDSGLAQANYTGTDDSADHNLAAIGCEIFSSAGGTGGTFSGMANTQGFAMTAAGCNIHDTVGIGISMATAVSPQNGGIQVIDTIVAKCGATGIQLNGFSSELIKNCTIDGNASDGISLGGNNYEALIYNNIISNHTGVGKLGLRVGGGATFNQSLFIDYNIYYNNTTDIDVGYSPHDVHGGANPYVAQSTENYTLA